MVRLSNWPSKRRQFTLAFQSVWERRSSRDILVISAVALCLLLIDLFGMLDIGELFLAGAQLLRSPDNFGLDDVVGIYFMLSIVVIIFSLRRMQDLSQEVRARRAAEQIAHNLARHDPLTGLPNRRFFSEKLDHALDAATAETRGTAVLMMDLDGFKPINDIYGHAVGDQALTVFAERVSNITRADALLARVGGDEFAIIQPGIASLDDPTRLARRIVVAVSEPIQIAGAALKLGVGIGIAIAPDDGATRDELMRRADRALYRAKAEGVSTIRFFEPQMDANMERRMAMEKGLRAALAAKAIVPHYQPLVSLDDNRITGFEALARWESAEFGQVAPDVFIPIAEECGLIGELVDHVLRLACRDASAWPKDVMVAVNLSAIQLRDDTLGLRVLSILAETGLQPHRLELELTESALLDNFSKARRVIEQLRQAGVRIALDDFGTGYATIAQLRMLHLDKIKIDRSFVDLVCKDPESLAIVRAILGLASGFGLSTLAEGIEDAEQLACLKETGCLEGQGYLFGKAAPASEVLKLLKADPRASAA
jgi:diguanylate cyclase (GGDEF)-like protein